MFSIIVPSYNRQSELLCLLQSLCEQTLQNFEVIVVDDCSRQPIRIEQSYPFKVSLIRNQHNQGPAQSRNIGAKSAVNNWLLFLDDDDRFVAEKCALLTQHITQQPHINFIYHPAICQMINEGFCYQTKPYQDIQQLTLANLLSANKIGGMPMLAVKKAFFVALGGLTPALNALEDYEFVLKAVKHKDFRPHFVAEALTLCRFQTQVMSVSKNIANTQQALNYIEQHYVQNKQQQQQFSQNRLAILAYPYLMSLSRRAAKYYYRMAFAQGFKPKMLVIAMIILLSPKLAVNLKRFI
ncbi:glycosyl transferase family 2 [Volucribacter psittacicida]|uniref:Glycosyl transferase family 2 n=1 Tax=Volucribacter psittacicida TaxID=203482 RepID=A0A4R1FIR4_9PAST|nr:glycosyltransferase family 2 protein [Volucribacter psittacicida]TCJ94707.1 glycosyl transferase family 2 [Volucribacter psittacicida]